MSSKLLTETTLTLFFTKGISLRTWAEVGNLDREMEIYKRLNNKLQKINIVTYGGKTDTLYKKNLNGFNLLSVPKFNNSKLIQLYLLLRYLPQISRSEIIKTNQLLGSEVPIWLKNRYGQLLIVRCGYLYSYFTQKMSRDKNKINRAIQLEKDAFSMADSGIVTSAWQRDFVIQQYKINPSKIKIIPNYVVTEIFKPHPEISKKYDLVFVGRGAEQKNINNLLKAIAFRNKKKRNTSLLMVGGCCYDKKVRKNVDQSTIEVTFKGNISNFDLPYFLNQARVFILPSHYEGHPKTLLEAMSCGLTCIGSDVMGIREDIIHMNNGYLCKTDHESIAAAIDTLLSDESLRKRMGNNAREYILSKYTIDHIFEMELNLIQEVINKS